MPTRLNLEIQSHAPIFAKQFKLFAYTNNYLQFVCQYRDVLDLITIYRTSAKCFRLMRYVGYCGAPVGSQYKSFRTIQAMCFYLETECTNTMYKYKNKIKKEGNKNETVH